MSSRRRWSLVTAAVLVLAAGLLGLLHQRASDRWAADEAARVAADEALGEVLSYTPDDVEADLDDEVALMTTSFGKKYRDMMTNTVIPAALKDEVTTQATVIQAGVVGRDGDDVEVLLFVNLNTVTKKRQEPSIRGSRVLVTMTQDGDNWLVAGFNPV